MRVFAAIAFASLLLIPLPSYVPIRTIPQSRLAGRQECDSAQGAVAAAQQTWSSTLSCWPYRKPTHRLRTSVSGR